MLYVPAFSKMNTDTWSTWIIIINKFYIDRKTFNDWIKKYKRERERDRDGVGNPAEGFTVNLTMVL